MNKEEWVSEGVLLQESGEYVRALEEVHRVEQGWLLKKNKKKVHWATCRNLQNSMAPPGGCSLTSGKWGIFESVLW